MFELTIKTDSAAFNDESANGGYDEIARILRNLADMVEQGGNDGALFDINGNRVGFYDYTPDRD